MTRILVVDDEDGIRDVVSNYLEFEGYDYMEATDGFEAIELLKENDFDLVVLDVMMPKLDGMSVLREIRKTKRTPVIMLSARGEEYDKLYGFEMGADDYIVKPFSPRELIARIKILLKRCNESVVEKEEKLVFGGLVIDEHGRNVWLDDKLLDLTPKEFALLLCLCKNADVVLSRDKLLTDVWGYDYCGDYRTVDTHIKMLRSNIGEYRKCIKTIWGIGYKFEYSE